MLRQNKDMRWDECDSNQDCPAPNPGSSAKPRGSRPPNHSRICPDPTVHTPPPTHTTIDTHHCPHPPPTHTTIHTHCPRWGRARRGNSRKARRAWAAPSGQEQDEGGRLEAEGRGPGTGPAHAPAQQTGPEDLSACLNRMYQVPGILTHTPPSLPKGCCNQSEERNNTRRKTSCHKWGGPGASCTQSSVPPACKPGPPGWSQGFSSTAARGERG